MNLRKGNSWDTNLGCAVNLRELKRSVRITAIQAKPNPGTKQTYAERKHEFFQHHCGGPDSCHTNRIACDCLDGTSF